MADTTILQVNSGDITNVKNLKSIQKQIQDKLTPTKQKLDLIISNGNTNDKHNRSGEFINMKPNTSTHFTVLDMQKMEISQVIAVIAILIYIWNASAN